MSKTQTVTAGVAVLFIGLSAWQWMELKALREENGALNTAVKKFSVTPLRMAAPEAPAGRGGPGGGEGGRRPRGGGGEGAEARADRTGGQGPSPEQRARFQEMRATQRLQRIDARILALKTKMNLTPEQETVIREAMAKSGAERDALREAAFTSGNAPDPALFAANEAAQEAAIQAAFTPEQQESYAAYKEEEAQNRIETAATRQLTDLQSTLMLSEEQKDLAFQAFAKLAQEPREAPGADADPVKAREARQAALLSEMESILTPEQYTLYQKQEEQRAQFRGPGGPGGGGPPPGPPPP